MLKGELRLPLYGFALSLSGAIDAVRPALTSHQKRTAYIAWNIGKEIGLDVDRMEKLLFAGLLHDIGSLSLKEKLDILTFDEDSSYNRHAELGYLLFKDFKAFSDEATFIRYHHVPWEYGKGQRKDGQKIPIESHILHLADRISVAIDYNNEILAQVKNITERIKNRSGEIFMPELVKAFIKLSSKEYIWLDVTSPYLDLELSKIHNSGFVLLNVGSIRKVTQVFSNIIDFRSRFTSTHSSGVAACAVELAKLSGFSGKECNFMEIAGYLHDLGKLAVPKEILEKPGKLTTEEFNIVKSHTYHTYRILSHIPSFEMINQWASFHHERLDGSGYPFHIDKFNFSLGSRIMAVSDVFTALTEDRPYRRRLTPDRAFHIIEQMAQNNILDTHIVFFLKKNLYTIDDARKSAQMAALNKYKEFSQYGVLY